jgi:hypothetical protein
LPVPLPLGKEVKFAVGEDAVDIEEQQFDFAGAG